MKKVFKALKKYKKPLLAICFAAAISIVVYTDMFGIGKSTPTTDYLYNADYSDSGTKILGEAELVGTNIYEIEGDSYFASAIVNRERSRDEALETLQVVVDSSEEFPERREMALSEIMDIASYVTIEATVEEMIKAKGFEDCVAIVSGGNINVIVKSEGLLTSEVAQITDIVKSETGFSADNIRIVEKM